MSLSHLKLKNRVEILNASIQAVGLLRYWSIIAFLKYKFVFSKELIRCFLLQLPIFLLMVIVTQTANDGTTYWIIGILVTVLLAVLSFYLLSKRLSLVKHLMARVKRIMK